MTKNNKIIFSVITPVKAINNYIVNEIIPALKKQSLKNFELILVPDKRSNPPQALQVGGSEKYEFSDFPEFVKIIPSWPKLGPADKKDIGAKNAKGKYLAFLDDDAYPSKNWLKIAKKLLQNKEIAGVCGPGVTPPDDSLLSKVSGWLWSTWLGAGGAGTYRCRPEKRREVDDYPTFNLIIKKEDFNKIDGFDSKFWPGEDTKLCHDLVYKLKKKIIYDPKILVYHHRRDILVPHLKQIGRYGLHRGYFVKILPKTSKRLGYFIPGLFTLGVIAGPFFYFFNIFLFKIYLFILLIYLFLLLFTSLQVLIKSKNLLISLLLIPTIFISHLFYGLMFLKGLLKKDFRSKYDREKI